jgi:hypothetical protein
LRHGLDSRRRSAAAWLKAMAIHDQLAMNAEQRYLMQGREGISYNKVEYSETKGDVLDVVRKDEFTISGRCEICIYKVLYKLEVKKQVWSNYVLLRA